MPFSATESRGQECLNQFPGERVTDDKPPKTDYVQIVVFDALVCRKVVVNQAGSNSCYFISRDGGPRTTSTDGHASLLVSAGNCTGQRHNKIRIIIVRLRLAISEIAHLMAAFPQHASQIFLQLVSSMVGGDTYT